MVVGAVSTVDISDRLGDFSGHRITCSRAEMTPELKQALKLIKATCQNCPETHKGCPLHDPGWGCRLYTVSPDEWEIDEWEKEDENGRS